MLSPIPDLCLHLSRSMRSPSGPRSGPHCALSLIPGLCLHLSRSMRSGSGPRPGPWSVLGLSRSVTSPSGSNREDECGQAGGNQYSLGGCTNIKTRIINVIYCCSLSIIIVYKSTLEVMNPTVRFAGLKLGPVGRICCHPELSNGRDVVARNGGSRL